MPIHFILLILIILIINCLAGFFIAKRIRKLENVRKDFIANVSHELRTPITSIKGFTETLIDSDLEDKEEVRHFLEIIRKHSDRLNAIIEDLLSLARIEQDGKNIKFMNCKIISTLENAIEICKIKASEKNIAIDIYADRTLKSKINPSLVEQAVVNLIDNAMKYSEKGAKIIVRLYKENKNIVISVEDFGCGIKEKHLSRLFERFYRVDKARSRKQGGTGLGLSIVKHIAEIHKGSVSVKSELEKGSTFFIKLAIS